MNDLLLNDKLFNNVGEVSMTMLLLSYIGHAMLSLCQLTKTMITVYYCF